MTTAVVKPIPKEISQLIPLFKGDKRQLNLYLRKCQYVIDRFGCKDNEEQNLYVYNVLTSRLAEDAAALLSERDDVVSWSALKELLIQHFGDPRSEACINIELESLKIKSDESYLDFCNRIQSVRSLLMSKVNTIESEDLKRAKLIIYNNTALNVFLYNLPENMVRVVRLKAPATLEAALSVVLEEVNFLEQYNMRNRIHGQIAGSGPRPSITQQTGSKAFSHENGTPPKFNFGIPQNSQQIKMPQMQMQGQGQPQNAFRPPAFGYRPQFGLQPPQQTGLQQFGYKPPQQFGYRPPQQLGYKPPQQFGYTPPQPFGYRPTQQFGYRPPQQFGYKPPQQAGYRPPYVQPPQLQTSDVSMKTAVPKPQQGFKLNELTDYDYDPYCDERFYYDLYGYYDASGLNYCGDESYDMDIDYNNDVQYDDTEPTDVPQTTDFPETASKEKKS